MVYRTLLVDDEKLALTRLDRLLARHRDQIEIVGTAANGREAIDAIRTLAPELVFLDIHLGAMSGFEVLEAVTAPPLVIFTTAYDQYALRAFDTNSIDYLLKPIEAERLARALDKIASLKSVAGLPSVLLQKLAALKTPQRIAVKLGGRIKLLEPEAILYFRAGDKYVEAVTLDHAYLISRSLTELESELKDCQFIRTHRSVLVNARFIDEIGKSPRHGLYVLLKDPARTRLPLSRQAKANLNLL